MAGAPVAAATVDFKRDVEPIFQAHCYDCHGPAKQKGGIRLDDPAALKGGDSGEALLIPGDAAKSHLMRLVRGDLEDEVMPPKGERLTSAQVDTLAQWVKQGANWPKSGPLTKARLEHWSSNPPVRPAVPAVAAKAGIARNPIDHFILERLQKAGLKQSPEADKHALVRRVTMALTGLPPTPAEMDLFLADTAPDAYERLVDRLLASPAFGERWARPWLDLARFADSAGYGSDPLRFTIHRYRDWVIQAYNANMPYDQFVIEQLAGDLLPNSTTEQLIATAFHRNTMTNTEGGTDDEEFRVAAVKDRTDVTMQVFMGLTMGCAQCHTHKFDPITITDYYSVYAIFNQTEDSDKADESPTIPTPTEQELKEKAKLEAQIAALEKELREQAVPASGAETTVATAEAVAAETPASGQRQAGASSAKSRRGGSNAKPAAKAEPPKTPQKIADLKKKLNNVLSKTAIMRELPKDKRRPTHILQKGSFLSPGDPVQPAVLGAFHSLPGDAPADRLGLARWIVAKDNPLTARVEVNRVWAQFFGTGLVETQEDFGEMGTPPSHPELLDWLATEFSSPEAGRPWDRKRLMRLIVTSQTFRQSAKVLPEHLEQDAANRLLARMPRQRLEAEMVRDQALAVSGLLSRKMFGPSVYPPQPDGLWQAAFNGQRTYPTSKGEDRYRRGVYVFWRRTVPYPSMQTFDAPSREVCTVRRIHTSTPLQAFVTMNDPVYVECSQALGRRLLKEGGDTAESRVRFGLELVLNRPASPEQVKPLLKLYESELQHFKQDAEDAKKLATDPIGDLPKGADTVEAAAWTVVANVMLNLDSAMTR